MTAAVQELVVAKDPVSFVVRDAFQIAAACLGLSTIVDCFCYGR